MQEVSGLSCGAAPLLVEVGYEQDCQCRKRDNDSEALLDFFKDQIFLTKPPLRTGAGNREEQRDLVDVPQGQL